MNDETATNIEYLGEVRKGLSSVLKVSVGDYQGRPYIYVQAWEKDEQDIGPGVPTRLGLTLRPGNLRALLPLFEAALKVAAGRKPERAGRGERDRSRGSDQEDAGMEAYLGLEAREHRGRR